MHDRALEAAVGRTVGAAIVRLENVRREPLVYDAFLAGRSLTRIHGTALTRDGAVAWSMIEKVTEGPAVASAYLYDNGLREFRAYESGLLGDLAPSVSAPTAYGLEEGADGRLTLLLEDLGDPKPPSATEMLGAARDLGRLTGRWIGRVPSHGWLFTGWIDRHRQPEAMAPALARLRAVRSRSAIESRVGWGIDEAIQLIEDQASFTSLLGHVPQTLCHHDAVAANVFRPRREAAYETVLIDWEMVGPGPIGADLVSLLFSSARRGDTSAAVFELLPEALEAYGAGMDEMGGRVNDATLRLAFHAAITLRWTLTRDIVVTLQDGTRARRGSAPDETPDDAMTELIALSRILLDSAREARQALGR